VATDKPGEGTPPISTGTFVSWPGGSGRVNMVVTSGQVPGVPGDIEGTAELPAARVVVWEKSAEGGWNPSGKAVAVQAASLEAIQPLPRDPGAGSPEALLVAVHAYHQELAEEQDLPPYAVPSPTAVKTVYERGLASWPESKAALSKTDWALSRVGAFLELAAGAENPEYVRDVDLLPDAHPLRQA